MLKKKAREIAFESLVEMKVKHSKMNNLEYKELKLQEYFQLPRIRIEQVREIFKFRTRMLTFGENFRGAKESVICPLCRSHADSQAWCLQCPAMMKELSSSVKLDGIYGDEVTIETAETIEEIMKIRKRIIENGWKWKKQDGIYGNYGNGNTSPWGPCAPDCSGCCYAVDVAPVTPSHYYVICIA